MIFLFALISAVYELVATDLCTYYLAALFVAFAFTVFCSFRKVVSYGN
ncbi:MAG: hypothetical protein IJ642_06030 [Oscillospiraceae bacterium]|nr:hypothetical protein [Oscillospiraceae bacterium]MBR1528840.1 hypothetical protein [Oscillospiraceae bacterium]